MILGQTGTINGQASKSSSRMAPFLYADLGAKHADLRDASQFLGRLKLPRGRLQKSQIPHFFFPSPLGFLGDTHPFRGLNVIGHTQVQSPQGGRRIWESQQTLKRISAPIKKPLALHHCLAREGSEEHLPLLE